MGHKAASEFEIFFKENQNTLYRIVKSYVKSRDTAKDIVLETMMIIYDKWQRVLNFENKTGYAVRIAINKAKKMLLSKKLKKWLPLLHSEDEEQWISNLETPEEAFIRQEENRFVENELQKLKENERNIIILKDIDEKKLVEIAVIMNMNLSTVKSHYRRGKLKLSKMWEANYV